MISPERRTPFPLSRAPRKRGNDGHASGVLQCVVGVHGGHGRELKMPGKGDGPVTGSQSMRYLAFGHGLIAIGGPIPAWAYLTQ